ncbi:MAG: hypothetical protein Q9219_004478, partial [cf. Caloplaca sp. 3 TL-2023]
MGNIVAAPVALSPNARDGAPGQITSVTATIYTSNTGTAATASLPLEKRAAQQSDIDVLEDIVFPQKISASPSSTTSAASSTFEFSVNQPPEPTPTPVQLARKNIQHEARQRESGFGALEELSFPQKISSS